MPHLFPQNGDELAVGEITDRLEDLGRDLIRRLREYEQAHKNHETTIEEFERLDTS